MKQSQAWARVHLEHSLLFAMVSMAVKVGAVLMNWHGCTSLPAPALKQSPQEQEGQETDWCTTRISVQSQAREYRCKCVITAALAVLTFSLLTLELPSGQEGYTFPLPQLLYLLMITVVACVGQLACRKHLLVIVVAAYLYLLNSHCMHPVAKHLNQPGTLWQIWGCVALLLWDFLLHYALAYLAFDEFNWIPPRYLAASQTQSREGTTRQQLRLQIKTLAFSIVLMGLPIVLGTFFQQAQISQFYQDYYSQHSSSSRMHQILRQHLMRDEHQDLLTMEQQVFNRNNRNEKLLICCLAGGLLLPAFTRFMMQLKLSPNSSRETNQLQVKSVYFLSFFSFGIVVAKWAIQFL